MSNAADMSSKMIKLIVGFNMMESTGGIGKNHFCCMLEEIKNKEKLETRSVDNFLQDCY